MTAISAQGLRLRNPTPKGRLAALTAVVALSFAPGLGAAVTGRYILFGNALSERMGLVEVEVHSGGRNLVLNRPEVFTAGLDYGYWMMRRDPQKYAALLVDGDKDTEKRVVDFGAKVSRAYGDTTLYYCSFEMDLGEEIPVERIGLYRSRHRQKQPDDLGWRYLVLLDAQRRIVAWEAFNVYGQGWEEKRGAWLYDLKPATGAPAGRVVPPNSRCWLSEAEYIRDFLDKPEVDLVATPTAADEERLAQFQRRHDPAAIAALGERFFPLLDLERPSLREVKARVQARDYAGAFAAFRKPFLETTAILRHWNAGEGTSIYVHYAWTGESDTLATLRARDLRNRTYGDSSDLSVKRFVPGLLPPARMQFPFQTRPLLLSYAANQDIEDLRLWEMLTEDWAMGFQAAADQDPKLREHFVLTVGVINATLKDLYSASQTNPNFVNDVSGVTLARLLMPLMEELPVSYWRVTRKCVFNHTFNAVASAFLASQALADFRVGQRLEREVCQALQRLHTYAQYRDGPMVETCDEGHFVMNVVSPGNLYGMLSQWQPAWFTPALEAYFLDHYRQAVLAGVRHVSPSGAGSRWPGTGTGLDYLAYYLNTADPYWRNVTDLRMAWGDHDVVLSVPVLKEPEPRAIIDTVFGRGRQYTDKGKLAEQAQIAAAYGGEYQGQPQMVSDWLPYAGVWYFRRGWDREDSFLQMLKPSFSNSHYYGSYGPTQAYEFLKDTSYRFQDYATPLLTTFAADIDKQMICPAEETRFPSGSKQEIFTQAVEKPQPARWHTDATFDFGEAIYRGNYHSYTGEKVQVAADGRFERRITFSPVSIRDVSTTRQIFQVRPARLFLQVERIAYATPTETHTNRIETVMLLTEPGPETGKTFSDEQFRLDRATNTVTMRNPGNPGATVAYFGQPGLTFRRLTVNGLIHHFYPQPDPERETGPDDATLYGPFPNLNGPRRTSGRGLFASWEATGASVLVSCVFANRPDEEPVKNMQDLSTDSLAGVQAETTAGVHVRLLVARHVPAQLAAGPLAVTGEALLWVEGPGRPASGLVLGATDLAVQGKAEKPPCADFAFTLDPAAAAPLRTPSGLGLTPIRTPLDPPTVGPAVNVFSDSMQVEITSVSPDAEIRYTTDTSDPTAASALYREPIRIAADTFIKARTFRQGVTGLPFTTAGTDVSAVSYGSFFRRAVKPAMAEAPAGLQPGLDYDYMEGRWFALWTYADALPATKTGTTDRLLEVSMRATDGPFAVRYRGCIDIPATGVYTFYGPEEYVRNTCEPGYDLRLSIDGEEWYLGQTWHGLGLWSVPLEKGLHRFLLTFADARARDLEKQRTDLGLAWPGFYPQARTTWRGVAPVLEVSGPGVARGPVPDGWFRR